MFLYLVVEKDKVSKTERNRSIPANINIEVVVGFVWYCTLGAVLSEGIVPW